MLQRSAVLTTLCLAAVIFSLGLTGCPREADPAEMGEIGPDVPVSDPIGTDATEGEAAAASSDFAWTEAPTVEMIPSGPIRGMMNGKPFEAKTVRIEKDEEGVFELNISNVAVEDDDPTGIITGDDAWQLTFSATEGETGSWTWAVSDQKDFDKEHVYYYYQQGEDKGPMSVNYSWGAALRIDDWTVEEPPADADSFHKVLGNVKGGVILVMDDDENSWVAGEFDAVYYEW